jgi:hypothetical protein
VSSSDFRDTLVDLIEISPEPVDHPSADQWLAYRRGQLPAGEEARLQEHLVRCRECFDLAGAAAAFTQEDEAPGTDHEVETAALWRLLRPQLDPPKNPPVNPPSQNVREISAGSRRQSAWRFRLPMTLAASFFVMLVGLAAWNLRLRHDNEALRAPKPNSLIADLSAGERFAKPLASTETLSAQTGMLVIHPSDELPVYRVTLRDAATGGELWSYELRPDKNLALTLQLPEGLRPGGYLLELSDGSGGGAGKVLETFRLAVKEAGKGA